jgi:hypothetical protein
VSGRELDAVELALRGQPGGACVARHDVVDLLPGERARLDVEALAWDGRRSDRVGARRIGDQLPASVEELHEEPRPVRANRVDDAAVAGDDLVPVTGQGVRREASRLVDGGRLEDYQPGPAGCARLVVGDEVVRRHVVVDERRLVRGRDDPVAQLDRTEPKGTQEVIKHRRARARERPARGR